MDTTRYIEQKFSVNLDQKLPIELDASRFKELIALFRELNFKVGAEIGVAKGKYSKFLCRGIPNLKLYLIDSWRSYGEYVEHHDIEGQTILDNCYKEAKERLAPYNCEFVRATSMDAVKTFEDKSLDFVFIDANHTFEYVVNDIAEWSKKVRPGGIVSGHDFWRSRQNTRIMPELNDPKERIKLCQVKDAVESWTYANQIKPWFIVKNDNCPSWFYVKSE